MSPDEDAVVDDRMEHAGAVAGGVGIGIGGNPGISWSTTKQPKFSALCMG